MILKKILKMSFVQQIGALKTYGGQRICTSNQSS